jgi:uncharacterized protein (DUF1015 family)
MRTKAFAGLVPAPQYAADVAAVPYDVVNTEEARALGANKPRNLIHVDRAEIDLPEGTDPYSDAVYEKAAENFRELQASGVLEREQNPCVYLYRQEWRGQTQTGIALACHIDDYENDIIRKHEKTRPVKEDDRTRLVDTLGAHTGPIFLTYRDSPSLDAIVTSITEQIAPTVDIVDENEVHHVVWKVEGGEPIIDAFSQVPLAYVADGHHRSASAWRVGSERRAANPDHDGSEGYNWFLGVLFPASQLQILPYNRLVKDLNGRSVDEFLAVLKESFDVEPTATPEPEEAGNACMYLDGKWYRLSWPTPGDDASPIDRLDVSVLQDRILSPLLAIEDPRTDNRVDFVGGIRGTGELEKRVDGGDWAVAFSVYPVTIDQLMDIADAGEIMPPKSTWFEPKLRSGLFIYTLD